MHIHTHIHKFIHKLYFTFLSLWAEKALTLWWFSCLGWPNGPGQCAENGPLCTCIYPDWLKINLPDWHNFYIHMHKWYDAISITFIQENVFFSGFGWPNGPGCCVENGSLYTCIYSVGQMGKPIRTTYMQLISITTKCFLLHFYTFQSILNMFVFILIWRIRDTGYSIHKHHICNSNEWHVRYIRWYINVTYGSNIQ